ncbi:MAG: hypothetical protein NZ898_14385 [Myxococcota bacterium]|nr:hypothetical protein [Myxococcota bacterium]MDW8360847.1 hypothetical protein [Myxococcales bacterium]
MQPLHYVGAYVLAARLSALGLDAGPALQAGPHARLSDVWARSVRPQWMVRLAAAVGVDRRRLVAAVLACVEQCLENTRPDHDGVDRALDAARRWTAGSASGFEAWAAGREALEAWRHARKGPQAHVARLAAAVARACDADAEASYYARQGALEEALEHLQRACGEDRGVVARRCADVLRSRIDVVDVEQRLERAAAESRMTIVPAPTGLEVAWSLDRQPIS